jgi:4-nitrophenyl phosphatase
MTLLPSSTRGLILDMDGVLWRENTPIGDLANTFKRINEKGLRVILATNNSTKTISQYIERLQGFGVNLEPWQVITSSLAVAVMLEKRFSSGGDVYVVGEAGLRESLEEKGFRPISAGQSGDPVAVVAAIDREVTFQKLREATLHIRRGVPFYGTNPDRTFPTPDGLIPGAGSFLSLLTTATDVNPIVAGKPEPYLLELALERLGTPRKLTFVVGDRLETDIAGGQNIGCPTGLVLSGVSTLEEAGVWTPKVDVIADDLASLIG